MPGYGASLRTAGPLLTSGLQIAIAIGLMGYFGYWLDHKYETSPWLMVAGIFFGATAGLVQFIRTVNRLEQKKSNAERDSESE